MKAVRRTATVAGLAIAALLGGAAHSAVAAKQWTPARIISDPGEQIDFPDVALNAKGHGVAVWYREDSDSNIVAMRASNLEPGSGFGDPETVGPADPTPGALPPTLPQVAVDRQGNAIASWLMKDGAGDLRVMIALERSGGQFGPPQTLSPPGASAFDPQIAFDRRGGAVAVWVRNDDGVPRVQGATRGPGDADFGHPEWLSKEGLQAGVPQLGVSDAGGAVAAWLARGGAEGNLFVQAARLPKGGEFGAPQTLSDQSLTADELHVSVAPKGSAVAGWNQATPKSLDVGEVATAFAPPGQDFNPAVAMSHDPDLQGIRAVVGMDGRGQATVVWEDGPALNLPGTHLMRAALTDRSGAFTGEQLIEQTDQVGLIFPALAVARSGDAAAAWIRDEPDPLPRPLVATVRAGPGLPFGAVQQLSPPGASGALPSLAANRRTTIAIWDLLDGNDSRAAVNFYRAK